jgi:type IV secretion system protein TrbL
MKRLLFNPVLVLLLLLLSAEASAASTGIDNANVLDNILERFASTASLWSTKMVSYGTWLFWGLTLLSMVWTYGLMALKKADIQEFLAETIRFFSVTGFFLWILQNGPAIAIAIINSMRQVASEASGLSRVVSPSSVVDIGFDIAAKVADTSSIWSPASSIVGLIIAAVILVVLALVGVNMLLMLISAWLLAYGGVFLLGFGGGRWTQDIAINYYKTVLGIAMQTFTMILIVGIGKSFIDQYYAAMGGDMAIKELFVMLVVSIILLVLVNKLPPMIAGIVGGGGSGGGVGGFGMGAALGAAGMAAGMAAGAASAALGAGASGAGGASALKAAFTAAQQGMAASGGGSPSGGGFGGGLAGAVESAGRFATAMGTSLAQGAADVAKEKMSAMKEAASARIADTVGGKIASKINEANENNSGVGANASSAASNDNSLQPDFGSDSLGPARASGGQGTPPVNDEVAAFASKSSFGDARS